MFPNYASLDGSAGVKTRLLDEMQTTPDLITHLKSETYRDPNTVIIAPNETGWASCAVAIDQIDQKWDEHLVAWRKGIEKKLSGNAGLSALSGSNDLNLGSGTLTSAVIARYFPNSSASETSILKTLAIANLLRDSLDLYLSYNGSPTSNADNMARRTTTSGWLTAAKFFNAIVHTTRAVMEGIIYGFGVLLPLFFVFGGLSALLTYSKIALWLQLWVPFYVILNLYADQEVVRILGNIFLTETAKAPTLKTIDHIAEQLELALGYVGSLGPIVPALAWGLVAGSERAVDLAVRGMGTSGASASAASAGSSIMGSGNMSTGNMSMGNDSIGSSTVLSSHAAYKANLMSSMSRSASLNEVMPAMGGAAGYIDKAGQAGAITETGNIAAAAGKYNGAGRSMESIYDVNYAEGHGHITGTINAAKARADATGGGSWQDAAASNIEAQKIFDTAKTLGAEKYMKEMGFNTTAEAVTLGELQRGYAALSTYNMGHQAGYDMNSREGRQEFCRRKLLEAI